VSSRTPLFTTADAAAHSLAQGRWALHGPGCEVAPGQPTPDCAISITVKGDRIMPEGGGLEKSIGALGPMAAGASSASGPSEFLLVAGDPEVMQLRDLGKSPGGDEPATQRAYMAFKPLGQNAAGMADKGILWLITCPKSDAPGLKVTPEGCEATTGQAVRDQARHVPPFFSFFMTWVAP
jgi:hypothetical protein